jgi:threonine aldolase
VSLASGLDALGLAVQTPETNMVYVNVDNGPAWQDALEAHGVRCFAVSSTRLRLVVHLDIDDRAIQEALTGFTHVLEQPARGAHSV